MDMKEAMFWANAEIINNPFDEEKPTPKPRVVKFEGETSDLDLSSDEKAREVLKF